MDARPHAAAVALDSLTAEREEQFTAWLVEQVALREPDDVILVEETRAFWVLPLWSRAAEAAGARLTTLTMLRHPTQVVRSRDSKRQVGRPDDLRTQRETTNVAAWLNALFETERVTRGYARSFVLYDELVADWRTALDGAGRQLGLDLGDTTAPHAVDDFLDVSLNRSANTWDGLEVGAPLVDARDETVREIHQDYADRLESKNARIASLRERVRAGDEAPAADAVPGPTGRTSGRRGLLGGRARQQD